MQNLIAQNLHFYIALDRDYESGAQLTPEQKHDVIMTAIIAPCISIVLLAFMGFVFGAL